MFRRAPRRRWLSRVRSEKYAQTQGHCAYCGKPIDGPMSGVLDHMDSLHNHGSDTEDNLVFCCRDCNRLKAGCSVEGFRKRLVRLLKRESGGGELGQRIRKAYIENGWAEGCRKFFFEQDSGAVIQRSRDFRIKEVWP